MLIRLLAGRQEGWRRLLPQQKRSQQNFIDCAGAAGCAFAAFNLRGRTGLPGVIWKSGRTAFCALWHIITILLVVMSTRFTRLLLTKSSQFISIDGNLAGLLHQTKQIAVVCFELKRIFAFTDLSIP